MHEDNPDAPTHSPRPEPAFPEAPADPDAETAATLERESWARTTRGLSFWFIVLAVCGIGGLLLGHEELAALATMSGLFVASHAADLDRQWRMLHSLLAWVVPVSGAAAFVALAFMLESVKLPAPWGALLVGACLGGAFASVLTLFRPFSHALATWLFRTEHTSHTLRLAARLVFVGFLFAVPGWFAIRNLFDTLDDEIGNLIQSESLGSSLVGYILLALASVGFLLRRDWRATLERLGVGRITATHWIVVALGVLALYAFNSGADWIQRTFFHDLWLEDQRISQAIGGGLGVAGTIVLGLSAGIGEEVTMRGALQPKLGLIGTSLLFSSFHVQYSWFGMTVIFLLGLMLGLVRKRANTSVAMAIHALYDMAAVLSLAPEA
jgi:uncharacterized protein